MKNENENYGNESCEVAPTTRQTFYNIDSQAFLLSKSSGVRISTLQKML